MAELWYYKMLGDETGPLTFNALRELFVDGHISTDDEVRLSTSSWLPAKQVPGLCGPAEMSQPAAKPEAELSNDFDIDSMLAPSVSKPSPAHLAPASMVAKAPSAPAPPPQEEQVAEWYYYLKDQEAGPATEDAIIKLMKNGSIQADDMVRLGTSGSWKPVVRYPQYKKYESQIPPRPEWYCRVLGQVLGPLLFDEVQEMAHSGNLNADDEVRFGEDAPWKPANRVKGLSFEKRVEKPTAAPNRGSIYRPFGADAERQEWYFGFMSRAVGPFSFNEVAKAVTDGELRMENSARRGKVGAWVTVIDIPGLLTPDEKKAYLEKKAAAKRPKPAAATATAAPAATGAAAGAPTAPGGSPSPLSKSGILTPPAGKTPASPATAATSSDSKIGAGAPKPAAPPTGAESTSPKPAGAAAPASAAAPKPAAPAAKPGH